MNRQVPLLERMRQELDAVEASGRRSDAWRINATAFRELLSERSLSQIDAEAASSVPGRRILGLPFRLDSRNHDRHPLFALEQSSRAELSKP
ncbi:hypothetical protein H7F50_18755 [Novosphingobium flavum]|uniref:hypothetical protein n=1 Tax=Novosphingobium aerophilum TaxID=2839843 RepID=UPI00163A9BAB|nr:hypothetical protein [Novosphingobium aerophilum]MBC2663761.1 hypothetical protein [Novosphingobium aerophilum]